MLASEELKFDAAVKRWKKVPIQSDLQACCRVRSLGIYHHHGSTCCSKASGHSILWHAIAFNHHSGDAWRHS